MKQQFPKLKRTTVFVYRSLKSGFKPDTDVTTTTTVLTASGRITAGPQN